MDRRTGIIGRLILDILVEEIYITETDLRRKLAAQGYGVEFKDTIKKTLAALVRSEFIEIDADLFTETEPNFKLTDSCRKTFDEKDQQGKLMRQLVAATRKVLDEAAKELRDRKEEIKNAFEKANSAVEDALVAINQQRIKSAYTIIRRSRLRLDLVGVF